MRLLLISLAALFILSIAPISPADAHGDRSTKSSTYRTKASKTKVYHKTMKRSKRMARRHKMRQRAAVGRSCGTYMYWKNGRCNDARDKKSS